MHFSTITSLALFGLASAAPVEDRASGPKYPKMSESNGFHLVVNVTDTKHPFYHDIHGGYINSRMFSPLGAWLGVGTKAKEDFPRVFYMNGTELDTHIGSVSVFSDAGSPAFPNAIHIKKNAKHSVPALEPADKDDAKTYSSVAVSRAPIPLAYLTPESFAVCKEKKPNTDESEYIVKNFWLGAGATIPKDCAEVRLIPECTALKPTSKGAKADHKFVLKASCYKNVAGIDWTKYGTW